MTLNRWRGCTRSLILRVNREAAVSDTRIQNWQEFWPFYLGEHRSPFCRLLHVVGSTTAVGLLVLSVVTQNSWALLVALVIGYSLSWIGHFFVERNRPASFRYPLWSFFGDWKMVALFWTRRLDDEVTRLFGDRHPTLEAVSSARTGE
jgi:hypothetical protein